MVNVSCWWYFGGRGALTLSNMIVTIQQRRNYGRLAVPDFSPQEMNKALQWTFWWFLSRGQDIEVKWHCSELSLRCVFWRKHSFKLYLANELESLFDWKRNVSQWLLQVATVLFSLSFNKSRPVCTILF